MGFPGNAWRRAGPAIADFVQGVAGALVLQAFNASRSTFKKLRFNAVADIAIMDNCMELWTSFESPPIVADHQSGESQEVDMNSMRTKWEEGKFSHSLNSSLSG
jgi:hypothetical protein